MFWIFVWFFFLCSLFVWFFSLSTNFSQKLGQPCMGNGFLQVTAPCLGSAVAVAQEQKRKEMGAQDPPSC